MLFFDFEVFKHDWLIVAIDPINKEEYVIANDKQRLQDLYHKYKDDIFPFHENEAIYNLVFVNQ